MEVKIQNSCAWMLTGRDEAVSGQCTQRQQKRSESHRYPSARRRARREDAGMAERVREADGRQGCCRGAAGAFRDCAQAEPSLPDAPGLFRAWVFTSLSTDVKENEPRLQRLFSCPSFCTDVLHHEEGTPDSSSVRRLWRHVEPGLNPI